MTNLHRVVKRRDITLLTKVCIVKAIVFPAVLYRCESWITKNADTTLLAENEEELRSLLMRVKKETENAGLKLSNKKEKKN